MGSLDFESVCQDMRLDDGTLWPIPITLDVPEPIADAARKAGRLALVDDAGAELATIHISEVWRCDRRQEARAVYGTSDPAHPGVSYLIDHSHSWNVAGDLSVSRLPEHPHLPPLVYSPAKVRAEIERRGWTRVVAFNTRNPMHHAHRELVLRAARDEGANILIHPVVGVTRPGDIPPEIRVRCYRALMRTLPESQSMLSLLPLAMRMAGPREALWHAIIRRNYGATAFIIGRDHAGPGVDAHGRPFYDEYAAQELVGQYEGEIGIRMVPARQLVYVDGLGYMPEDDVPTSRVARSLSGTQVRRHLADGTDIPDWLMQADVVAELREAFASRKI